MEKNSTSITRFVARVLAATIFIGMFMAAPQAAAETRELYLYYTHTKETAKIVFKRNGRYDQAGLKKLNVFLRDWRRNEPAKMDPALFDLVWEVYRETGARKPIHVVSAYRSPATNEMLRSRSNGVAKNSRHTMGMAMDFFIPGVPLSKLREAAFKKQMGGVGYYPTSGSPFVHLDTGNVRAWPRMTRTQLAKIFPDGKTLHLPNDGKPLSQEGYQYAKAQWSSCQQIPCTGSKSRSLRVASSGGGNDSPGKDTLFGMLFGDEDDEGDEEIANATQSVAVKAAPVSVAAARSETIAPAIAPQPAAYPAGLRRPPVIETASVAVAALAVAPAPHARPSWREQAAKPDAGTSATALAAIEPVALPAMRLKDSERTIGTADVLNAYAPKPVPEAQRALEMLLARQADKPDPGSKRPALDETIHTAAIGPAPTAQNRPRHQPGQNPVAQAAGAAEVALVAPNFQHVATMFATPKTLSSEHFAHIEAKIWGGMEGISQLGTATPHGLGRDPAHGLAPHRFAARGPLVVAKR